MVDPGGPCGGRYDPESTPASPSGWGPDRMAMVKYGIPDLRLFFEGDLRFLSSSSSRREYLCAFRPVGSAST
jgi:phenylalanyl-tRNA synthetase alpha chain